MDTVQKNQSGVNENTKNEQLEIFRVGHDKEPLTSNQGLKVSHTDDSLKAGTRGPTLMEDFHFREKITHFDHERIPERVVHARGAGAHGYFQVYESLADLTKAKFLQDPAVKTPVFVRFSTVVGSRGSADTVRDVRGFVTKFYTEEGNYDLVGNNIPIFFIQDAIKFPDIVHSIKPEPDKEIPQASAAHDTFWDFMVNNSELAHMILWLLSDRGIPRSFRMMEGFGVNTFRLINEQGQARFVKFHWKPLLGVHSLVWDEAQIIAGKDPDFNRGDLWNAIEDGEFPEYELGIQVLEQEQEFDFNFDILDPTKFWPEELIPVRRIGKMTLNRNVDNFFAETEQVAFHPANVVPGIDFTNDPLLQGRLFSYLDTQLIRLGGPNFHEIPINRPVAPVHTNQRDAYHRMTIDKGKVSYSPNMLQENQPHPASELEGGYVHYEERVDGRKVRERSSSFKDHYSQAALFWNSMSDPEKQHIIEAFHFEVGKVKNKTIKERVVDMFNQVNGQLAIDIASGIGVPAPTVACDIGITESSAAVSQANTTKLANTRRIAVLVENGYNHNELLQLMEAFKLTAVHPVIISKQQGMLSSSDSHQLEVQENYHTTSSVLYDAVYIPGGQQSIESLMTHGYALHFINQAFKHCKAIGASNEGVDMLIECKLGEISLAGSSDGSQVFSDAGVVTVRNANQMSSFADEFLESIAQHRHWCRQAIKEMVRA